MHWAAIVNTKIHLISVVFWVTIRSLASRGVSSRGARQSAGFSEVFQTTESWQIQPGLTEMGVFWLCTFLGREMSPFVASHASIFSASLSAETDSDQKKKTRCSNSLLTKCTSNPDGDFFFESWNLCVNRPETNTSFVHRCQVDGPLDPQDIHNAMRREAILAKLPGGVVAGRNACINAKLLNYIYTYIYIRGWPYIYIYNT